MKTVFISYSRKDGNAAAEWKTRLENRTPCQVFLFHKSLKAGQKDWIKTIESRLRESAFMLVLISKNSIASLGVGVEVGLAVASNVPLYPVSLDGTDPDELSRYTGNIWALDANDEEKVSEFIDDVVKILEQPVATAVVTTTKVSPATKRFIEQYRERKSMTTPALSLGSSFAEFNRLGLSLLDTPSLSKTGTGSLSSLMEPIRENQAPPEKVAKSPILSLYEQLRKSNQMRDLWPKSGLSTPSITDLYDSLH